MWPMGLLFWLLVLYVEGILVSTFGPVSDSWTSWPSLAEEWAATRSLWSVWTRWCPSTPSLVTSKKKDRTTCVGDTSLNSSKVEGNAAGLIFRISYKSWILLFRSGILKDCDIKCNSIYLLFNNHRISFKSSLYL